MMMATDRQTLSLCRSAKNPENPVFWTKKGTFFDPPKTRDFGKKKKRMPGFFFFVGKLYMLFCPYFYLGFTKGGSGPPKTGFLAILAKTPVLTDPHPGSPRRGGQGGGPSRS